MSTHPPEFVRRVLHREWETLSGLERRTVEQVLARAHAAKAARTDERTFGERVADRIAAFGGSWTFILLFIGVLVSWVLLNSFVLARRNEAWDPYPYILLNLFLSMLAALQAPIIMMSQNRQAQRDRLDAAHDYEVNLKAEIEIRALHEKLDLLREESWAELVEMQRRQIELLEELLRRARAGGGA